MIHWGNWQRLLCSKRLQFCNSKIGPGAPPIKTEKGWLTTFHTVTESEELFYSWSGDWNRKYCMGIMLLDQEEFNDGLPSHSNSWCPDAKHQKANLESPYVTDLSHNDAVYVSGGVISAPIAISGGGDVHITGSTTTEHLVLSSVALGAQKSATLIAQGTPGVAGESNIIYPLGITATSVVIANFFNRLSNSF